MAVGSSGSITKSPAVVVGSACSRVDQDHHLHRSVPVAASIASSRRQGSDHHRQGTEAVGSERYELPRDFNHGPPGELVGDRQTAGGDLLGGRERSGLSRWGSWPGNVLTAEVLWPLSCLPRGPFLGEVLRHAHGAKEGRLRAAAEVEEAVFTLLPDQIELGPEVIVVPPDATIVSPGDYVLVEAKRISALEVASAPTSPRAHGADAAGRQSITFLAPHPGRSAAGCSGRSRTPSSQ